MHLVGMRTDRQIESYRPLREIRLDLASWLTGRVHGRRTIGSCAPEAWELAGDLWTRLDSFEAVIELAKLGAAQG